MYLALLAALSPSLRSAAGAVGWSATNAASLLSERARPRAASWGACVGGTCATKAESLLMLCVVSEYLGSVTV